MAAGLGFKEFTTGDVLTAADANGYLASQVVMVFADAAARTSAIASPQEGMISYLKDTNSTEYYSGSAWAAIGGGGGGGKVLQVVSTTKTDVFSTSSTTMVDVTGLTATITPSSATSKIFIIVSGALGHNGSNERIDMNLRRDSTDIGIASGGTSNNTAVFLTATGAGVEYSANISIAFLDAPASTSAITYGVQIKTPAGTALVGRLGQGDRRGITTITVMEIAA